MAGERHGRGMDAAWARHAMCESAFKEAYNLSIEFQTVPDPADKGSTLLIKAIVYQSARRHVSEDLNLHQRCSYMLTPVYKEYRLLGCGALYSSRHLQSLSAKRISTLQLKNE